MIFTTASFANCNLNITHTVIVGGTSITVWDWRKGQ